VGVLNISLQLPIQASDEPGIVNGRECSKKFVQQGRSHFDARSVRIVRGHGKRATVPGKPFWQSQGTPLADFFNSPWVE